jgi:hypothetical protein
MAVVKRLLTDWRSPIAVLLIILGGWLTVYAFQRTFGEGLMIGLICVCGGGVVLWSVIRPDE